MPSARPDEIERSLQERLHRLDDELIPRLEEEASETDDPAATALLTSAQRERAETFEALERTRAREGRPRDAQRIEIGDTVDLIEEGAEEPERYVLVWDTGPRLSDAWISQASPLGRALVGRARGETVVVDAPGGATTYRIADFVPAG
jgi:transcription elongation factor GreA